MRVTTTLTVCGSSGSYPSAGRACSSYLLRSDEAQLVLDLGNGSLSNLLRWVSPASVTDLVISHGHHDHFADLIGLLQLASYGLDGPPAVRVYANADTCAVLRDAVAAHAPRASMLELHEVTIGETFEAGGFEVTTAGAWHSQPGVLTRATAPDGTVTAYTGDSDLCDDLIAGARGADLLVSEATWPDGVAGLPQGVHMTAGQAGELARRADVGALLVTHVWPEFKPSVVTAQCAEVFGGPTTAAEDGLVLRVGGP
jgi:ribonuclease BN (tRNA processing enzyme)